jgi:hypothetical protein
MRLRVGDAWRNLCLDAAGGSGNGSPITPFTCHGGDNQKVREAEPQCGVVLLLLGMLCCVTCYAIAQGRLC